MAPHRLTVRLDDENAEWVDQRAEVVDILADNTSLEELFNQYTGGGRDGETAGDLGETDAQEVSA